jgi:acetoin utilization deacetylase AcuC-like enzyme
MYNLACYYPIGHESHYQLGHPERPERVEAIRQAFKAVSLWDTFHQVEPVEINDNVLFSIHSQEYIKSLEDISKNGQYLDMDTYTTPATWSLSLRTAGGAVSTIEQVWNGSAKRGLALTRPPGHHATRNMGMGFCILNNIAIATEHLIHSHQVRRVAIIDFDLHHGNGTQDIFWKRGDVFYISTHQSPLYPGSGALKDIGVGDGLGKTANLPLPPGSGDNAFKACTEEIILPLCDQFKPEALLISYGFDPHWMDPLGHLQLSASGYGNIIGSLTQWADQNCDGKIVLFLEGGYSLEAAAACSLSVVNKMLGRTWDDSLGEAPRPEGLSWKSVIKMAKDIWNL